MSPWKIAVILLAVFVVFSFIHYCEKSKRPFRRALLSMLIGPVLLFAVNLTGSLTGVSLPVSLLSLSASVIGGVPGVTLLLFLNLIFGL